MQKRSVKKTKTRGSDHIGPRCKEIRLKAGINRKAMASLSGLSEVAIFNFETKSIFNLTSFYSYINAINTRKAVNLNYVLLRENTGFSPFSEPDIKNLNTINELAQNSIQKDTELEKLKMELAVVKKQLQEKK